MTKKLLGMKNRNGLKLDDLRMLVRAAEGMSPYVKLKAKVKMNGTLIELTIDEPEEPEPVKLPPFMSDSTTPVGRDEHGRVTPLDGTAHPIDSRRARPLARPND
jgi:hypothetical protein